MNRPVIISFFVLLLVCASLPGCVHKPKAVPAEGNFPPEIASILIAKCAISGCHNAASYVNANGLLLDTWEHLFLGGNSGSVVVPFNSRYSSLLYYCNTDSSKGPVASPTMPLSTATRPQNALTTAEYQTLVTWIDNGAPDKNGNIAFAANADTRQKIYVTQQGCDLVAVIDGKSKLIMRYIPIGMLPGQSESPHDVAFSSDGRYAYVPLFAGSYVQKIDVATDKVVANAALSSTTSGGLGQGGWSLIALSPQDTSFMVTGYNSPGYLVNVNTATMKVNHSNSIDITSGNPPGIWSYPHGIAANPTFDTFITCLQWGNALMKYSRKGGKFYNKYISINGTTPNATFLGDSASPDPHQVLMAPDFSKYFVSCQGTSKVVIMDARTDSVIVAIPVGAFPQEMDIYPEKNLLFVACLEDQQTKYTGGRGSVYVINYSTNKVTNIIYGDFFEPHDIAVDRQDGLLYVVSENYSPSGPPPHHVTACGVRAGWYTVYDLNTFLPADNKRYEMTYFPYAMAARFK